MRRPLAILVIAVIVVLGVLMIGDLLTTDRGFEPARTIDGPAPAVAAVPRTIVERAASDGAISDVERAPADARGDRANAERDASRTGYRGRVLATDGTPVPGIGVRLYRGTPELALPLGLDPFGDAPADVGLVAAHTRTDRDGRFELDGVLPRGLCFVRLEFPSLDEVQESWRSGQGTIVPVQRTPSPGEIVDLGDLFLRRGATLVGRIVGDEGRPVAGALVRAARLPNLPFAAVPIERLRADGVLIFTAGARSGVLEFPPFVAALIDDLPIASAASDRDGRFTIYGVDPGDDVVAVTADGRAGLVRPRVRIEAGATTNLGDLTLPSGCVATVEVVGTDGVPIAGADVVVAPQSTGIPVHIGERAGPTNADGRVVVAGLPRGAALAAARRDPDDAWRIGAVGSADGVLRVELPATCSLTLTVLDPAGDPASGPRIRLVDGVGQAGAVELAMFGALHAVDLGKRFRQLEDGRLRIEGLALGSWCVVVGAAGCATESVDLQLGGDTERTIRLRAARSLRVRTIDVADAPVAGATIYVQPRGGSRAQRVVDLPLAAGETDADGWCTVRDLPTEETRISAMHPRHGLIHTQVDGAPAELVMRFALSGAIHGKLTDGGRAPTPGRWMLVLERRYDDVPRGAMPDVPELTLPDLDGAFAFEGLQPGRYRVTAQDSVADVGTIGGIVEYQARRKQIYPWNKAEVDLHGGERADVRLDAMLDVPAWNGPGAAVTGVVTLDGVPGANALVVGTSTKPDRRVTSRVDASGVFDLGRCPVGTLRVVVVPREVAESRLLEHLFSHHFARDIEIVDGVPQELRIDVETGSVDGAVRDWNGLAVDDCRVVLFDRGGDGRSSALRVARTGIDGRFAFPQMPAGVFELRAQREGFGLAVLRDVRVTAGSATSDLTLNLRATAALSGRIEISALPRPAPFALILTAADDLPPVRGGGKADGAFEIRDVPVGRYRVEIRVFGDPIVYAADDLDVIAPRTADLHLVPRAR